MQQALAGIRVVELASWGFVPSAGAVLSDWGAEVIKVEPPTGDPMRGLATSGLTPTGSTPLNFMFEWPNRGKRSMTLDITHEDGHELFMKLIETADVLITSYLPQVRQKLRVDVDDVRARNPKIIYARGSGHGPNGPDATLPGYDAVSFWSRGGIGAALTPGDAEWPVMQRTPAFGDVVGGLSVAAGVAAALAGRATSGEGSVVDASLLSVASWVLSPLMTASKLFGLEAMPSGPREQTPNPLVGVYRTADRRFINLTFLQADKYWADFCTAVGRPELIDDPRFADMAVRKDNAAACVGILDEIFGSKTLAEWRVAFAKLDAPWAPMQTLKELTEDVQVAANNYLVPTEDGELYIVPAPAQLDETPPVMRRAPEFGADTETILLELGLEWEAIAAHKDSGAIP